MANESDLARHLSWRSAMLSLPSCLPPAPNSQSWRSNRKPSNISKFPTGRVCRPRATVERNHFLGNGFHSPGSTCYNNCMANDSERVLKLNDLFQISGWQQKLTWKPFQPGVDIHRLYGDSESGPSAVLLRFHPGGRVPLHEHLGYEHVFMLSGSQVDENSKAETGML